MLPPVKHRTQMGDILSWAGGRGKLNDGALSEPENSHPPEDNKPGGYKPSYGFGGGNQNMGIVPGNVNLKFDEKPVITREGPPGLIAVPPIDNHIPEQARANIMKTRKVEVAHQELQQNMDFLSKRLNEEQNQQQHLAAQNQGLKNQIFSLERVLRLLTDRLTVVENRSANVSNQLDERGRNDAEVIRKLQMQVRELQDGHAGFVKDVGNKLASYDDSAIRADREGQTVREQIRSLQADFRDFAVQSVYRQRQEFEQMIKNQFTKMQMDEASFRSDWKRQNEQCVEDIQRANAVVEEMEQNVAVFRGDARARLVALENAILCKNADGSDNREGGGLAGGGIHYREHLDQVRAQVAQLSKDLTDAVAESEADKKARFGIIREYETKIANMQEDMANQKSELMTLFEQRHELLEAKMGVEKHEVLARQAEIREELQGVDSLNSVCISDIELKCMNKLELFKKREEAERDALRQVVDTKLNQVCGQIARTETLRQDGLTTLYEKIEDFQTKQLETVKNIRQEVQDNIRDVQLLFKDEMRHRIETERKMTDSVREVVKNLSQAQANAFEQLSGRILIVDKTLQEARKESSERAERMSRYVDDVVAKWRHDNARQNEIYDSNFAAVHERIGDLGNALERTQNRFDDKITKTEMMVTDKCRALETKIHDGLELERTRFEDRQYKHEQMCHDEFTNVKNRMDRITGEFDDAMASVHRAVLGLSKDKSMIGANIVVPLPSWDRHFENIPVKFEKPEGHEKDDPFTRKAGEGLGMVPDYNPNEGLEDTLQFSNTFENLEIPKDQLSPFDAGTPPDGHKDPDYNDFAWEFDQDKFNQVQNLSEQLADEGQKTNKDENGAEKPDAGEDDTEKPDGAAEDGAEKPDPDDNVNPENIQTAELDLEEEKPGELENLADEGEHENQPLTGRTDAAKSAQSEETTKSIEPEKGGETTKGGEPETGGAQFLSNTLSENGEPTPPGRKSRNSRHVGDLGKDLSFTKVQQADETLDKMIPVLQEKARGLSERGKLDDEKALIEGDDKAEDKDGEKALPGGADKAGSSFQDDDKIDKSPKEKEIEAVVPDVMSSLYSSSITNAQAITESMRLKGGGKDSPSGKGSPSKGRSPSDSPKTKEKTPGKSKRKATGSGSEGEDSPAKKTSDEVTSPKKGGSASEDESSPKKTEGEFTFSPASKKKDKEESGPEDESPDASPSASPDTKNETGKTSKTSKSSDDVSPTSKASATSKAKTSKSSGSSGEESPSRADNNTTMKTEQEGTSPSRAEKSKESGDDDEDSPSKTEKSSSEKSSPEKSSPEKSRSEKSSPDPSKTGSKGKIFAEDVDPKAALSDDAVSPRPSVKKEDGKEPNWKKKNSKGPPAESVSPSSKAKSPGDDADASSGSEEGDSDTFSSPRTKSLDKSP